MTQNPYDQPYAGPPPSYAPEPGPVPEPGPDRRLYRRNRLILGGVLLAALIAGAVIVSLIGSSDRPLKVTFALIDIGGDSDCSGGDGGYDDIGPGMPLTVKDQDGKIIGSGTLPDKGEEYAGVGCEWTLHVMVPDDAQQYAVEGGSRGAVTFSHADLEEAHWEAHLSIGD